eukprot:1520067-Amphidinium_carterae.1
MDGWHLLMVMEQKSCISTNRNFCLHSFLRECFFQVLWAIVGFLTLDGNVPSPYGPWLGSFPKLSPATPPSYPSICKTLGAKLWPGLPPWTCCARWSYLATAARHRHCLRYKLTLHPATSRGNYTDSRNPLSIKTM